MATSVLFLLWFCFHIGPFFIVRASPCSFLNGRCSPSESLCCPCKLRPPHFLSSWSPQASLTAFYAVLEVPPPVGFPFPALTLLLPRPGPFGRSYLVIHLFFYDQFFRAFFFGEFLPLPIYWLSPPPPVFEASTAGASLSSAYRGVTLILFRSLGLLSPPPYPLFFVCLRSETRSIDFPHILHCVENFISASSRSWMGSLSLPMIVFFPLNTYITV